MGLTLPIRSQCTSMSVIIKTYRLQAAFVNSDDDIVDDSDV